MFTFPDQGNFTSCLWQVIQRWFSHKPAEENLRFAGCMAGDFWLVAGGNWVEGCF